MATKNKSNITYNINKLKEAYQDALSLSGAENNLENFINFLKNNKLSTVHAEEIYSYIRNEKNTDLRLDSIKIRKSHPKRDAFIKKVLIPTAVTSGAIGGTMGAIAGSTITAGSTFAQIIPVMGSATSTAIAASVIGAGVGIIATPVIIIAKNKLTRSYYNNKYKSAKFNLKSYINGTKIEDLHISTLIEKIENSKHSVLDLSKGNWFTKTLKFLPKHMINAVNRNRIHHLEKYTKDLVKMYNQIHNSNLNDTDKSEKLKPIYELIKQVDDFIINDTFESKLNAMLTCKDSKKHTHKSTIENVDIFSNLITYVEALNSNPETMKANLKQAKLGTKNLNRKTTVAKEIMNGERLITKMLGYGSTYSKFSATTNEEAVVSTSTSTDGKTILLNLENGKSVKFNSAEVPNTEEIQTIKLGKNKSIITYTDGTTTEILKPKKVIPEIETTRLVMLDKLKNDTEFVTELTSEGHNKKTVTSLIKKLTTWLENPTKNKFSVPASSNAGKLYRSTLDKIDDSMKEVKPQVFEFDGTEEPIVLPEVVEENPNLIFE
ncbi:MAG: hypothetical protein J6Q13_01040 [Clostridia bacterium]|nr:hypothetical protein [Clostridia bacterium]